MRRQFFEKISKNEKLLRRLKRANKITSIMNERGDITTDSTDIKREEYTQQCSRNQEHR